MKLPHHLKPGDLVTPDAINTAVYRPKGDWHRLPPTSFVESTNVGQLKFGETALVLSTAHNEIAPVSWSRCCMVLTQAGAIGLIVYDQLALLSRREPNADGR